MAYDPDDPQQNAYWDEVAAKQLDRMSQELYGQAQEAENMGFRRVESSLMNAYRAVLDAAAALRQEAAELRSQRET